ncbi:MAG: glycosyltransferase family 1 protein [Cytophagales bacterium]|nr:MAG: glycosyltransferase family 1 protein [Cytophagales bacterium]TAF62305.1 MAG: glycosyltransferase family 1 protein [Cytophagales bacterium]
MKIGIVVRQFDASEGGAFSYIHTLTQHLSKLEQQNAQFLVLNLIEDHSQKTWDRLESKILVLNKEAAPMPPQHQKELQKLQRKLWFQEVLLYKFKLKRAETWRQESLKAIREFKDLHTNLDALLKDIARKYRIDFFYYPRPFLTPCYSIPFVATVWDCGHRTVAQFPEVSQNNEYQKREDWFLKTLQSACGVVVESEAGYQELEKFYGLSRDKTFLMPMFASAALLSADSGRAESWFKGQSFANKPFLLYPAQFWAHKNHQNLLHALAAARTHGAPLELVLCGSDQGYLQTIKQLTEQLGLTQQVHFLGFVSTEELKHLYEKAFALVMPTFLGPTNMPLSEAQSLGCPVVCSNLKGHREQTGGIALFFDPHHVEQLSEQLLQLYEKPELRQKLIEEGKKNAQKHSIELYLDAFIEFCERTQKNH